MEREEAKDLEKAQEWLERSVGELEYIKKNGVMTSSLLSDCTETTRQLFAVRSTHEKLKRRRDSYLKAVEKLNQELFESWKLSEALQDTLNAYLSGKRNDS